MKYCQATCGACENDENPGQKYYDQIISKKQQERGHAFMDLAD